MGDRALVVFTDKQEVSPTVYLHWAGAAVPAILEAHKVLMASRGPDLGYAAARFVGLCHARDAESNLSLGMWNTAPDAQCVILEAVKGTSKAALKELETYSHGDAGFIVVDVTDYSWKAYGGYLAKTKAA